MTDVMYFISPSVSLKLGEVGELEGLAIGRSMESNLQRVSIGSLCQNVDGAAMATPFSTQIPKL